jgi:hypothetical protein
MIGIVCDPRPRRGRTEGRGRTFESCRAHGSTKPFSRDRNAEKCTIRPSYSASVRTRGADEPCPEGAGGEGLLGLPDRGPGRLTHMFHVLLFAFAVAFGVRPDRGPSDPSEWRDAG